MSYASMADLEERLGSRAYVQLTDDEGTGSADLDKVTEALEGAAGEVDSYLGRRYRVPVAVAAGGSLAAVLKSIVLDLAEYRLFARRPALPDDVRRKRDAAVQWLQRVAAGNVVLPATAELEGNTAEGVAGEVLGQPRVMSRDDLRSL